MEPGQVESGAGDQSGESCDEVQEIEATWVEPTRTKSLQSQTTCASSRLRGVVPL